MFKLRTRLIRWLAGDDLSVCIGITVVPKGAASRRKYATIDNCEFIRTSFTQIDEAGGSGIGDPITESDIKAAKAA